MRDQRGFSLAELLIGLLILTIVVTTSLAVFVERNRRLQQASETILAYQALSNEAEYWRRVPFARLASTTEFYGEPAVLAPLRPFGTAAVVSQTSPGVRNVMLTVSWRRGVRRAQLQIVRVDTGGASLW